MSMTHPNGNCADQGAKASTAAVADFDRIVNGALIVNCLIYIIFIQCILKKDIFGKKKLFPQFLFYFVKFKVLIRQNFKATNLFISFDAAPIFFFLLFFHLKFFLPKKLFFSTTKKKMWNLIRIKKGVICKLFSSLMPWGQNKLECLSLATFFRFV